MSVEEIGPYLEPVRKSVTVPLSVADAFEVFTGGMGRWWPFASYSISQARTQTCVVEPRTGGLVFEVRDDGERFPWARVLAWEPPHRLVLSWYPGREPETGQEVELRFVDQGGGSTRVELEHRDWQKFGKQAPEARGQYEGGWELVFVTRYAEACRAAAGSR